MKNTSYPTLVWSEDYSPLGIYHLPEAFVYGRDYRDRQIFRITCPPPPLNFIAREVIPISPWTTEQEVASFYWLSLYKGRDQITRTFHITKDTQHLLARFRPAFFDNQWQAIQAAIEDGSIDDWKRGVQYLGPVDEGVKR